MRTTGVISRHRAGGFLFREGGIHRRRKENGSLISWQAQVFRKNWLDKLETFFAGPILRNVVGALRLIAGLVLLSFSAHRLLAQSDLAARVIVLANRADPESIRLAHYYAEQRHVPLENIVELNLSLVETITWPEFVSALWQPLQDRLVDEKWIEATGSRLLDGVGRKKYAINGHRIAYLVVCRGVPLRVENDPTLPNEATANALPEIFRTNQAAVDSELALLAANHPVVDGFVANPLFKNDQPSAWQRNEVIKVSRLDGPTFEDARDLVDHAILAEKNGLIGRAYVDLGGIHPEGDRWLETTAVKIQELGFDLDLDRSAGTFPESARFDAPALYFGWYSSQLDGPMTLPDFKFPPGAVAFHIHSFSAATLRSASVGWSGPLIARGATATVGNVFEPYLQLTHRPDLLLTALVRGENFGDAAAYSCPAFSWQAIALGDPLYRPFATSLESQLANSKTDRSGYALLRQANLLERAGRTEEALVFLRKNWTERPNAAVGLGLATRLEAAGKKTEAVDMLTRAARLATSPSAHWAVLVTMADHLVADGAPESAVDVYERLFKTDLPASLKSHWLSPAHDAAVAAHDEERAAAWSMDSTVATKSVEK